VSYGSEDVLEGFLATLRNASEARPIIVIADNKPTESSAVEALAIAHSARYLPLEGNHGYGFAMNAAVTTLPTSVEWILLSNPDLTFSPGAIDQLVATGNTDAGIGSVGPAILSADGEVYPSARTVPSLRTGIGHALFANIWTENPWSRAYKSSEDYDSRRDAGWLSGACLLVRRSTFEKLDGFDTAYFMYFEDVDLGYRIGKLGLRNVYEPAARVTHLGGHSTDDDSARMIRAHHDSARRFLSRKYSGPLLWPIRAVLSLGLIARSRIQSWRAHN
jgi:N-acetylglucosaminyl-diphospho-decaprenol L-rhamnosyltransferase